MVRPRTKRIASVQKEFETFLHLFEKIMLKRNLKNVRAARNRRLHKNEIRVKSRPSRNRNAFA